jgi:hypothetical protein
MNIYLIRYPNEQGTPGDLIINREVFCHTLEDKVRYGEIKIQGETAIPGGCYKIENNYSNHFKKILPLVVNVPGFTGIRLHGGNTINDTEGCILCGMEIRGLNKIGNCKIAIDNIIKFLERDEENYIHIYPAGEEL